MFLFLTGAASCAARPLPTAEAQRAHGRGVRALRRLLDLKRTYPSGPFLAAIEQALQFGLFDLGRLEKLILKQVIGDFFTLDAEADDDA